MKNIILAIVISVTISIVIVALMIFGLLSYLRDSDSGRILKERLDEVISDRLNRAFNQMDQENQDRYSNRFGMSPRRNMLMNRNMGYDMDYDRGYGMSRYAMMPRRCFPEPWCQLDDAMDFVMGNVFRLSSLHDSLLELDDWDRRNRKLRYDFSWKNGKHDVSYHHAVFDPPVKRKLHNGDRDIVAQKSVCDMKKDANDRKIKYNIYSSDHHGLIWREVDLEGSEVPGTSWFLDLYSQIADLRLINGEIYVQLKNGDIIFILDSESGEIKYKGPDNNKIFSKPSQESQNCL